jgi:hypothetical protein
MGEIVHHGYLLRILSTISVHVMYICNDWDMKQLTNEGDM